MEQHDCCHCSQRKKERSPEEYKRLIHRLNRIEGQIRGIRGMVEAGAYCPDILVQAAQLMPVTLYCLMGITPISSAFAGWPPARR